jgi:hypothetical protein
MSMTERVVVLMTAEEKKVISLLAAAENLSLGNYIRQQVLGNSALLSMWLAELAASTAHANAALGQTLANLEASERERPYLEAAARDRAMAEFSVLDPELFAQIVTSIGNSTTLSEYRR